MLYHLIMPLAMIIWGLLIYAPALRGAFHFDDRGFIVNNLSIRDVSDVKGLWNFLSHPARFVTFYTFALNYHWHQLEVLGYHVVNLIIHLMNALGVWVLTRLILSTPRLKENVDGIKPVGAIAVTAAFVFLVHPVQTQAVSYICQRFASLATGFYIGVLCCYLKGRCASTDKARIRWFVGASLLGAVGMFTKEIIITLPLMIIFTEVYFLKRPKDWTHALRRLLYVGCLGLGVAVALIIPWIYGFRWSIIFNKGVASGSHVGDYITGTRYLWTQGRVIMTYLRLWIWPLGQLLDYDFTLSMHIGEPRTLLAWTGILFLIGFIIKGRHRYRLLSFAGTWFFITLLVESSVIVIKHVIFEHRMYLPSVGLSIASSVLVWHLLTHRRKGMIICVVIGGVLSILTFQRNRVWRTEEFLWRDVMLKAPQKVRGYLNLANAYGEQRQWKAALDIYKQALIVDPQHAKTLNNRGQVYMQIRQWDWALADFNQAIALNPRLVQAYNNRGNCYQMRGQGDLALADFNQAIDLDVDYFASFNNRGNWYQRHGQLNQALKDYHQALLLNPYAPDVYLNRANAYRKAGILTEALMDYARALKLNPSNAQIYNDRASLYRMTGQLDLALKDLNQSLVLNPRLVAAYNSRGNLWQGQGKHKKAMADYDKALLLSPGNPVIMRNRAKSLY